MNKFTLAHKETLRTGEEVYRIRALRDIPQHKVKKGDLGGFIQFKENLSQEGDAWVNSEAKVLGKPTRIKGDAYIGYRAVVKDNSLVDGNASVTRWATLSNVTITGTDVEVSGKAVLENVNITGSAILIDENVKLLNSTVDGKDIHLTGNADLKQIHVRTRTQKLTIADSVKVKHENSNTEIDGYDIQLSDDAELMNCSGITGRDIRISGHVSLKNGVRVEGSDIVLSDAATVEGKVKIASGVELNECVHIFNHRATPRDLHYLKMGGDISVDADDVCSHDLF